MSKAKKKILIIDDDPDFIFVTRAILESKGYKCDCAYSAKEGLQKIKDFEPALIILDIMMESLTAGFSLITEVRSSKEDSDYYKYRNIPILVISDIQRATGYKYNFKEIAGSSLLPVEGFIQKPVSPFELLAKVEELLTKQKTKK